MLEIKNSEKIKIYGTQVEKVLANYESSLANTRDTRALSKDYNSVQNPQILSSTFDWNTLAATSSDDKAHLINNFFQSVFTAPSEYIVISESESSISVYDVSNKICNDNFKAGRYQVHGPR